MATRDLIEAHLREAAAVTVRSYDQQTIETLTEPFVRQFSGTKDATFTAAFDAWMTAQGEKAPQSLPMPAHIWKHHGVLMKRNAPDSVAVAYERPSIEFRHQAQAVRELITSIGQGLGGLDDKLDRSAPWIAHKHEPATFDETTGELATTGREKCNACKGQAKRRAQIAEALELRPEAREPKARPCRCPGDGFIETKQSTANRESLVWAGPTEVYPCPDCRPQQFHEWRTGQTGAQESA